MWYALDYPGFRVMYYVITQDAASVALAVKRRKPNVASSAKSMND